VVDHNQARWSKLFHAQEARAEMCRCKAEFIGELPEEILDDIVGKALALLK